ncbi:hypothetical protein QCA50_018566 [Cerrena zonata]|uniref:Uncharacterized protein n=1 Tax=Cerrena zonata TaxID=2478898 RepID=A0AAW0FP93_9APHY
MTSGSSFHQIYKLLFDMRLTYRQKVCTLLTHVPLNEEGEKTFNLSWVISQVGSQNIGPYGVTYIKKALASETIQGHIQVLNGSDFREVSWHDDVVFGVTASGENYFKESEQLRLTPVVEMEVPTPIQEEDTLTEEDEDATGNALELDVGGPLANGIQSEDALLISPTLRYPESLEELDQVEEAAITQTLAVGTLSLIEKYLRESEGNPTMITEALRAAEGEALGNGEFREVMLLTLRNLALSHARKAAMERLSLQVNGYTAIIASTLRRNEETIKDLRRHLVPFE